MSSGLEKLLMKDYKIQYKSARQIVLDCRNSMGMSKWEKWNDELLKACVEQINNNSSASTSNNDCLHNEKTPASVPSPSVPDDDDDNDNDNDKSVRNSPTSTMSNSLTGSSNTTSATTTNTCAQDDTSPAASDPEDGDNDNSGRNSSRIEIDSPSGDNTSGGDLCRDVVEEEDGPDTEQAGEQAEGERLMTDEDDCSYEEITVDDEEYYYEYEDDAVSFEETVIEEEEEEDDEKGRNCLVVFDDEGEVIGSRGDEGTVLDAKITSSVGGGSSTMAGTEMTVHTDGDDSASIPCLDMDEEANTSSKRRGKGIKKKRRGFFALFRRGRRNPNRTAVPP